MCSKSGIVLKKVKEYDIFHPAIILWKIPFFLRLPSDSLLNIGLAVTPAGSHSILLRAERAPAQLRRGIYLSPSISLMENVKAYFGSNRGVGNKTDIKPNMSEGLKVDS